MSSSNHKDGAAMPTLRQLLLRLVVFTQLPAYLAIGVMLALHYQEERERFSQQLVAHAHALAFALDERMLSVQRQLEGLAVRVPASPAGWTAFRNDALLVQQLAGADCIMLVTAAGEPLLDSRARPGEPAAAPLPEAMMKIVRAGSAAYGRLDAGDRPRMAVAVPVTGDDGVQFALVAGIDRMRFQPLLTGQALPPGWISSIVDNGGMIVARVPDLQRIEQNKVREALKIALEREYRGAFEARSLDGIAVVTAYSHSAMNGWTSMVAVPRTQLYAPLWRSAAYQALTAAVLLTFTMILSLRISRRFVSSVDRLDAEAEDAAAGQPAERQPQPQGFAEARRIGELLRATGNAMRDARVRLSDSEERLRAILQTASDAIIVSDAADHRVVLMNDAAERLFGTSISESANTNLQQLMGPGNWEYYLNLCRNCHDGNLPPQVDLVTVRGQGRRADGKLFPMEYSQAHFSDAAGAGFCTIVARDITRRQQREATLMATRSELRNRNSDFQRALLRETALRQAAVARELHDGVGSSLAGVGLLLGTARSFSREPEAAALVAKAQEQVTMATRQVREISRGMMPAGQDRGTLVPALQHFASQTCELPGVSCRFSSRGDFDQVPAEVGGHLYRIVQEACNNALRHGGATHLSIIMARCGDRCRLTIRDNGSGCDPAALLGSRPGIGMKSMRARVDEIGGCLHASRRPLGGLAMQVSWLASESEQAQAWMASATGS